MSSGKAADGQGIHVDLFKALLKNCKRKTKEGEEYRECTTRDHMEGIRKLLNVVMLTGAVFESWQDEVMLTVPKVEGSDNIGDTRPIGLVPILRNALMGIQTMLIQDVWEETGILSPMQFGFVRKMTSAAARLIQNVAFEAGYLYSDTIAAGTIDAAHAFDSPAQSSFELALMRLGVPDAVIKLDTKINLMGRMRVRHARGSSPSFSRGRMERDDAEH